MMEMNRVMIIGTNSGAGKSTLARLLGAKLGIEPVHFDAIAWKPGWVQASAEEIREKVLEVLPRERWIIEGNWSPHLWRERIERADTIIFFDVNRFVCLFNAIRRRLQYHNQTRPDMGPGCPEKFDWEFFWWIVWLAPKSRKRKYEMLNNQTGKRIVILKNRRQMEEFLKKFPFDFSRQ